MKIYIDSDYKCYTSPAEGRTAIETDFFSGKCVRYIEGYRYVPAGQSWTREDGEVFRGEMIAPWENYDYLQAAQEAYEQGQDEILTTVESALGVGI